MADVTQILSQIEQGDPNAAEQLLPLVYEELRKLAAAKMSAERPGHTLQATALVHEAYARLVHSGKEISWESRGHFFGAAAEAMRRILVDHAKRNASQKRRPDGRKFDLDSVAVATIAEPSELLAIDEAISSLEQIDPVAANLVRLHCFAALSVTEAAEALSISAATAYRHWNYARAYLHAALAADGDG
jgi:RNA polymerase sigma factor (TIGR02999 family)